MQRNARVLENSSDLAGELLAALAALPKPVADTLRRIGGDLVGRADNAAVGTLGAVRQRTLSRKAWAASSSRKYGLFRMLITCPRVASPTKCRSSLLTAYLAINIHDRHFVYQP